MRENKYWYLASYPKSGNTWCRIFLNELIRLSTNEKNKKNNHCYLDNIDLNHSLTTGRIISNREWFDDQIGINSSELTESEIETIRPNVHNQTFTNEKTFRIYKIHDAYAIDNKNYKRTISTKNCDGIVYIVRNPKDIAVSMESFFGLSKSKCINFLLDSNARLSTLTEGRSSQVSQYLGTWDYHVNSWINQEEVPLLVLRYEDLLKSPKDEYGKLAKFLKIKTNNKLIEKASNFCSFEKLKEKERKTKFIENSLSGKPFFRFGREGEGLKRLSKDQILKINSRFKETLVKFRYLY